MGEKLTKERFGQLWASEGAWGPISAEKCWLAVQSHTEAIREETRAEVMKDHFYLGETVMRKREADSIIEVLANWNLCDNPGRHLLVACAINYAKKYGVKIWKEVKP